MFGGPPTPDTDKPTENTEAMGDYKLSHEVAAAGEKLFATPGRILPLGMPCPVCGGELAGKANKYTRSLSVWCMSCSYRVSR